jgi:hypothetical protein
LPEGFDDNPSGPGPWNILKRFKRRPEAKNVKLVEFLVETKPDAESFRLIAAQNEVVRGFVILEVISALDSDGTLVKLKGCKRVEFSREVRSYPYDIREGAVGRQLGCAS